VKLSIAVTNYSWPGGSSSIAPELIRLARTVDEARLDTLWVADHLLQMDPNATSTNRCPRPTPPSASSPSQRGLSLHDGPGSYPFRRQDVRHA